jgi:hypothetical protein
MAVLTLAEATVGEVDPGPTEEERGFLDPIARHVQIELRIITVERDYLMRKEGG